MAQFPEIKKSIQNYLYEETFFLRIEKKDRMKKKAISPGTNC